MKILLTTDTVGGIWTYAIELVRSLANHDVDVILATLGAPLNEQQRAEVNELDNATVYESDYKLEWMDEPWEDVVKAGDWLLDMEETERPDVVHLNSFVFGALPFRAPKMVVGHSCVLSWWASVKGEDAPTEWDRYRYEVSKGIHNACLVAAPTQAMLDAMERHYGPLPESVVITNGRTSSMFHPGIKQHFVLTAGRLWDEAKNVKALEKVAPELEWPVYVAGENKHPDGGEALHDNIEPLGRLSQHDLANWLSRAAIYAAPARYEPFGLSILEAGLSGCALVVGDIPSLREVWGDSALFVQPDDTDALKNSLNELMNDPKLRIDFAVCARRRALEFTSERMGERYLAAYMYLIKGHSASVLRKQFESLNSNSDGGPRCRCLTRDLQTPRR